MFSFSCATWSLYVIHAMQFPPLVLYDRSPRFMLYNFCLYFFCALWLCDAFKECFKLVTTKTLTFFALPETLWPRRGYVAQGIAKRRRVYPQESGNGWAGRCSCFLQSGTTSLTPFIHKIPKILQGFSKNWVYNYPWAPLVHQSL
jgi:hypothetical protein